MNRNKRDKYHYCREHEWSGWWSVKNNNNKYIALCFDKAYAKIISDKLNEKVRDGSLLQFTEDYYESLIKENEIKNK